MRDRLDELGETTEVALVTFSDPTHLAHYQDVHDLPYTILVDRTRSSYRDFGLGRGSVRRVWGWRALHRYVQILRAGGLAGLGRPTEDTLQLGGDFVIAPDGALAWGFWGEGPDDRPSVDDLIAAVRHTRAV